MKLGVDPNFPLSFCQKNKCSESYIHHAKTEWEIPFQALNGENANALSQWNYFKFITASFPCSVFGKIKLAYKTNVEKFYFTLSKKFWDGKKTILCMLKYSVWLFTLY